MNPLRPLLLKLKNNFLALAHPLAVIFLIFFWSSAYLSAMVDAAELDLKSEALQFVNDISIQIEDVDTPADIVVGKTIRLYATVHNNSKKDQKGVVRFYNERLQKFIGADQPFSAVAGGTDTVFIDIELPLVGENPVAIRIIPDTPADDNPANNKVTDVLVADHDTDSDGTSNRNDGDDDNDSVPDRQDTFPLDSQESRDTDQDGTGNNADPDDENDGVPDTEDSLPENQGPVLVLGVSGEQMSGASNTGGGGDGGGGRSHRWGLEESETNAPREGTESISTTSQNSFSNQAPAVPGSTQEPPSTQSDQLNIPEGQVGETMTFNTLQSYDPDGNISTITWDFGEGEVRSGPVVDYAFKSPGTHEVKVTVTDNLGESRMETIPVKIRYPWSPVWGAGLIFLILGLLVALKKPLLKRKI